MTTVLLALTSAALGLLAAYAKRLRRELDDARWRSRHDAADIHYLWATDAVKSEKLERAIERAERSERKHRLLLAAYRDQRQFLSEVKAPWLAVLEGRD